MDKRIRSPNYPALSLPEAIARVTNLYRELHTHGAPREDIAKAMGFNTLNGASATAISALNKYGLLEGGGDKLKVSDRALRILHPHSPEEKAEALREAAREPQLFNELAERFPGGVHNEGLVRNYLIRAGFAPSAVPAVIKAYRETSEMADREGSGHDSLHEQPQENAAMPVTQNTGSALPGESRLSATATIQKLEQQPQIPVIAIMDDHFVVNTAVRTQEKARALRRLIEMLEKTLPESETAHTERAPVHDSGPNAQTGSTKPERQHSALSGPDEGHLSTQPSSQPNLSDWQPGGKQD
jgi:hypothetical protein